MTASPRSPFRRRGRRIRVAGPPRRRALKIAITGRHLGVTDSMRSYAREKVEKLERYFDRATQARVTMDVDHDTHRVEIVLDVVRGVSLVGKAEAPDMYAALDLAEQKLSQQVRRFNQRLKDHHRREGGADGSAGVRERGSLRGPRGPGLRPSSRLDLRVPASAGPRGVGGHGGRPDGGGPGPGGQ